MLEANHLLTSPFNTDITKGYVMIGLTKAETNQRFVSAFVTDVKIYQWQPFGKGVIRRCEMSG